MKKRGLVFLFKVSLTSLLYYILIRTSQFDLRLLGTLYNQFFLFLCILLLFVFVTFINSWRWFRLNTALKIDLPYSLSILPTYLCIAFNNILPGSIGGDFFRLYQLIKQKQSQKTRVVVSALFDRLIGLVSIFLIIMTITIYYYSIFNMNRNLHLIFLSCLILTTFMLIVLLLSLLLPNKKNSITNWLIEKYHHVKIISYLRSFFNAMKMLNQSKLIIVEAIFVSILGQLFLTLILTLIISILHLPSVPFLTIAISLAIAQIVNLLPLTPGGIGLGEAAFANIVLLINPTPAYAYATAFFIFRLLFTVAYLPGILIGIFSLKMISNVDECHEASRLSSINSRQAFDLLTNS